MVVRFLEKRKLNSIWSCHPTCGSTDVTMEQSFLSGEPLLGKCQGNIIQLLRELAKRKSYCARVCLDQ